MLGPLLTGAGMILLTVFIHMAGLILLMGMMRAPTTRFRPHRSMLRSAVFIFCIVLGLVAVHSVEIFAYALVYLQLGVMPDLETALYFSTSTFTTLGYGDVVIENEWRFVAAVEGFNGFLLIGWSTAFLVTVIGRLRAAEFDWLDHLRDED